MTWACYRVSKSTYHLQGMVTAVGWWLWCGEALGAARGLIGTPADRPNEATHTELLVPAVAKTQGELTHVKKGVQAAYTRLQPRSGAGVRDGVRWSKCK